jgi:predicted MFS family arabinose efflux permease
MGVRTTAARLRAGGRGPVLVAIAAGWVFVLGGRFLVPAVLPQVTSTLSVGNLGGGVAVTVIWAAYALMQSPAGALADRLGERRLLTGSLLLSAGSVAVLGLAPAFLAFLGGCAAFGFATGLYGPARGTALARTFPSDDGAAIGATLAAGSVGSAVLPFLAGALVGSVSWRLVVVGLAPPLLVVAAFAWYSVPERDGSAAPETPPADELLGDVLRAVQRRRVAVAVAAVTLMLFAFQGLSAFYVTYLARSMDQRVAAGLFALLFLAGAVAQLAGGALADRYGARVVLTGTSAVGAVAVGAVPFVDGVLPLAALSVVIGTRLAIAPVSNAYLIAALPDAVTGTAWGMLRTAFFLLGATGSTVVGAMADRALFDEAFLLLAGVTAIAAALYAFLPPRDQSA